MVDAEMRSGDNAAVSEPFANKHHVRAGDDITLPLGNAQVTFHVVDVFYDYGSEKGRGVGNEDRSPETPILLMNFKRHGD